MRDANYCLQEGLQEGMEANLIWKLVEESRILDRVRLMPLNSLVLNM